MHYRNFGSCLLPVVLRSSYVSSFNAMCPALPFHSPSPPVVYSFPLSAPSSVASEALATFFIGVLQMSSLLVNLVERCNSNRRKVIELTVPVYNVETNTVSEQPSLNALAQVVYDSFYAAAPFRSLYIILYVRHR